MRRSIIVLAAMLSATAAAAQTSPIAAPAKPEKQICKRSAEIGSMIPTRKECHTRAEWDQLARANRDEAQAASDRRMGASPTGQ